MSDTGTPGVGTGVRTLVVAYVVIAAVVAAAGFAVVGLVDGGAVGRWSEEVPAWLAAHRSGVLDVVAEGSNLTDEWTVGALVAGAAGMLVATGYARHGALLVAGVALEVAVHLTGSTIVGRARPGVVPASGAPETYTAAFPSGHVAVAIVVYGGLAVVVGALVRDEGARRVMVGLTVVATLLVAFGRLYLGVHDAVDVLAGVPLGLAVLTAACRAVGPLGPRRSGGGAEGVGVDETNRRSPVRR